MRPILHVCEPTGAGSWWWTPLSKGKYIVLQRHNNPALGALNNNSKYRIINNFHPHLLLHESDDREAIEDIFRVVHNSFDACVEECKGNGIRKGDAVKYIGYDRAETTYKLLSDAEEDGDVDYLDDEGEYVGNGNGNGNGYGGDDDDGDRNENGGGNEGYVQFI